MARVGKLHVHELPYNRELPVREDVYKCFCGKEFFVEENKESGFSKNPKKWVELDSSPYSVEYDRTVGGEKFIGRAGPDTVFDEEPVDQLAGEVSDGPGEASGSSNEAGSGE